MYGSGGLKSPGHRTGLFKQAVMARTDVETWGQSFNFRPTGDLGSPWQDCRADYLH